MHHIRVAIPMAKAFCILLQECHRLTTCFVQSSNSLAAHRTYLAGPSSPASDQSLLWQQSPHRGLCPSGRQGTVIVETACVDIAGQVFNTMTCMKRLRCRASPRIVRASASGEVRRREAKFRRIARFMEMGRVSARQFSLFAGRREGQRHRWSRYMQRILFDRSMKWP
jgi:hypothetical protein